MKRYLAYIIVTCFVLCVGCDHNQVEVPQPGGECLMDFGMPKVEESRAGAGSTLSTAGNMKEMSIGVYGMYETGDNIFDNLPENLYYYTGAVTAYKEQWVYGDPADYNTADEPRKPWNRIIDHEFRAFHPYDPTGTDREIGLSKTYGIQAMTNARKLVLNYFTQTNKFDLMVARATRNPANDSEGVDKVTLDFKHTLAALEFNVKYATAETDYLTEAYLDGLYDSGTLYYGIQFAGDTEESIRWILPVATSNELYTWTGTKEFSDTIVATPFDGDGVIFVIPQTVATDQASFVFKTQLGDDALQRAKIPAITWEAGKKYVYDMTIKGAELDVAVTIKPWDNKKSNVDIYIQ